jgi:hypothetical protein
MNAEEVKFLEYLDNVNDVSNIIDEIVSFDTFWSDFNENNPFLGQVIKEIYEKEKEKADEEVIMERLDTGFFMKNFNELAFVEFEKEKEAEKEQEKEKEEIKVETYIPTRIR